MHNSRLQTQLKIRLVMSCLYGTTTKPRPIAESSYACPVPTYEIDLIFKSESLPDYDEWEGRLHYSAALLMKCYLVLVKAYNEVPFPW